MKLRGDRKCAPCERERRIRPFLQRIESRVAGAAIRMGSQENKKAAAQSWRTVRAEILPILKILREIKNRVIIY
jgi:hypothetical protein